MKREALILIGISGSGKSTYTKQFLEENNNYIRYNRDAFRETLLPNHIKTWYKRKDLNDLETLINSFKINIIYKSNYNIISDNTNVNLKTLKEEIDLFKKWGIGIKFKLFPIDVNLAKNRVFNRDYVFYKDEKFENNYDCSGREEVNYIDSQLAKYAMTEAFISEYYKDKII